MRYWTVAICTAGITALLGMMAFPAGAEDPESSSPKTDSSKPWDESGAPQAKPPKIGNLKVLPDSLLESIPKPGALGLVDKYRGAMPEYRPDPNTRYTILVMKPDPRIDFKMKYLGQPPAPRAESIPKPVPDPGKNPLQPQEQKKTSPEKNR